MSAYSIEISANFYVLPTVVMVSNITVGIVTMTYGHSSFPCLSLLFGFFSFYWEHNLF